MATKTKETEIVVRDPFAIERAGLILPSPSYAIRNNCQLGQWVKSDGVTPLGNKLDLSLVHLERMYGDLGKTKATHWLQLWAISPSICQERVVFVTYIKSIGLSILGNTILDCALGGKKGQDLIFKTSFTPKSNEYGSYFHLSFEMVERAEDDPKRQEIANFLASRPIFLDTNLPETLFPIGDRDQEELDLELDRRRALKNAA